MHTYLKKRALISHLAFLQLLFGNKIGLRLFYLLQPIYVFLLKLDKQWGNNPPDNFPSGIDTYEKIPTGTWTFKCNTLERREGKIKCKKGQLTWQASIKCQSSANAWWAKVRPTLKERPGIMLIIHIIALIFVLPACSPCCTLSLCTVHTLSCIQISCTQGRDQDFDAKYPDILDVRSGFKWW